MTHGIRYENPDHCDGFATWWCYTCNTGAGTLYTSVFDTHTEARRHNKTIHNGNLSVTSTTLERRAHDAAITALNDAGWTLADIAHELGLRDAHAVRRILTRLTREAS